MLALWYRLSISLFQSAGRLASYYPDCQILYYVLDGCCMVSLEVSLYFKAKILQPSRKNSQKCATFLHL